MPKEIFVAFGTDVDAVGGWLGSYGGEDSPDDISRGLFAGEVGVPRLLTLFERHSLRTTFFVPGHSLETFPDSTKMIVDAGHEIGIHGYSHENPIAMTRVQEEAILDRCIDLVEKASGQRPTGYVAPWWEFSPVTNELLLKRGIKYDHSLMHRDFEPYYVRVGDSWTKIDYSLSAEEWMQPLIRGRETDLVEIPASWYLDDLPPMMFIKASPNSHGFVNPRHLEEIWRDQFDWVYREMDYAVFAMTIHPDVSGRPQVLLMLERLIEHINGHDGVRWATFDEIADDFNGVRRRRAPAEPGLRARARARRRPAVTSRAGSHHVPASAGEAAAGGARCRKSSHRRCRSRKPVRRTDLRSDRRAGAPNPRQPPAPPTAPTACKSSPPLSCSTSRARFRRCSNARARASAGQPVTSPALRAVARRVNTPRWHPAVGRAWWHGWARVNDTLVPVVRDTDGRVFRLANLPQMLTVAPFRSLTGLVVQAR